MKSFRRNFSIALILLGILILLAVAYFVVRIILMSVPLPFDPIIGLPTLALLGNPFRTTRKVKVPSHFRKGHAERNTEAFFGFIIRSAVLVFLLLWLIQQLIQR